MTLPAMFDGRRELEDDDLTGSSQLDVRRARAELAARPAQGDPIAPERQALEDEIPPTNERCE